MVSASKPCAIIVPVYKNTINELEKISLLQCVKIFSSYQIIFISPTNLDQRAYTEIIPNSIFLKFDDHFFSSVSGYNELMISSEFYKRFKSFEYMLIYQLDAFVFKDELGAWIKKKIDYIGAPWFEYAAAQNFRSGLLMSRFRITKWIKSIIDFGRKTPPWVGNGGLSLRRIKKFYFVSIVLKSWVSFLGYSDYNEDMIWSLLVPKYLPFFKIATAEQAMRFSIETGYAKMIATLDNNLPFGVHGWYRDDKTLEFWKPYIENEGYIVPAIRIEQ